MDGNGYLYPYYASWSYTDANGQYHFYAITYAAPQAKPDVYIDGLRVTDAEFAAAYGYILPAIAYPPRPASS